MAQQSEERPTGASNCEYDLYAEMHELLQGNEALCKYIDDARNNNDAELEECFTGIRDQNMESVAKIRGILASRLAPRTEATPPMNTAMR